MVCGSKKKKTNSCSTFLICFQFAQLQRCWKSQLSLSRCCVCWNTVIKSWWVFHSVSHNFKGNHFLRWLDKCRKYNKVEMRSQGGFSICGALSLFTNTGRTCKLPESTSPSKMTQKLNMAAVGSQQFGTGGGGCSVFHLFMSISQAIVLRKLFVAGQ